MYLKDKTTFLDLKIRNTDDKIGISLDDNWCLIDMTLTNEEIDYYASKKFLTKKELNKVINMLKDLMNDLNKKDNLTFVKNYLSMKLYIDRELGKVLELSLLGLNRIIPNFDTYTVRFMDKEIVDFIELIESQIN